jgi:plasmid stabilization system protein ParE
MRYKIFWSERAKNDYKDILKYLNQTWSSKELREFANKIEKNTLHLISHPEIGTISKKKAIRRLVISKQTSLYYKIIHENIYIITLFDNRQSPGKLKF